MSDKKNLGHNSKNDFLKKPGSGYQAGENNLVKLLQGEAFKETNPGDLNVMQEIVDARKQSAQEDVVDNGKEEEYDNQGNKFKKSFAEFKF